ncbi:LysE family translocator [Chitinimonas arctica]|uniref:LysE family translocator n=1 Tax=Chitinimonas arctica TaxID=2594795 RepID=A0A516SBZ7_9NEIS|nr:LysE family translocator [Chitinimonas arctica]QDQ25588.1 LysE family translocator [Chitinimonas arctica]
MSDTTNLWLYFLMVFGVIILPGMDMAFVMGSSLTGGRRAGLAAVAGTVVGGVCHMIIAATGISVVLKLMPGALLAMLLIGGGYIGWIGWSLMRVSSLTGPTLANGGHTVSQSFFRALATCMLNPKAYIFMLAVFPQFIHAERGSIWAQAGVLSLITACTQIGVYGALALVAAQAQTALTERPRANAWMAKGVGLVLMVAAVLTLYSGLVGLV